VKPYQPDAIADWFKRHHMSTRPPERMSASRPRSKTLPVATVLVLDGDVLVRKPLCQYLRDCGYRVLEAASADEAITILRKQDIQVDVVLSDTELPGSMNGFSFAVQARSLRPGLEVVLVGTLTRAVDAAAKLCDEGPALMKPYDHKLVLAHIKRLIATRAQQQPS
jgi:CheY-like chemotaxis protein